MKKFSKILMIIASVCLLVAVMALAISANTEEARTEIFKVNTAEGVQYTNEWNEAVTLAQASDNVITLNNDWTLGENEQKLATAPEANAHDSKEGGKLMTAGIFLQGGEQLTLDLNGKTITQSPEFEGVMFRLYGANTKLTLAGGGTIDNVCTMVTVGGSASFAVDTKKPIDINVRAKADTEGAAGIYTTFYDVDSTANWYFKGAVNVTPADAGGYLTFYVYGSKSIVFDNVKFTVNIPSTPHIEGTEIPEINYFMRTSDNGVKIDFINSDIEMNYGLMFDVTRKNGTLVDLTGWLDRWPVPIDPNGTVPENVQTSINNYLAITADKQLNINAKNSSFVGKDGGYVKDLSTYQSCTLGAMMTFNETNMNANFENCYLEFGSRVVEGTTSGSSNASDTANSALTGETPSTFKVSPARFTFKNCDFVRTSGYNYSPHLFTRCPNVIWEGGSITDNENSKLNPMGYYYDEITVGENKYWYGAKYSEVEFSKSRAPQALPADVSGDGQKVDWSDMWTSVGTLYQNYQYIDEDGVLCTIPYYLTSTAPTASDRSFIYKINTSATPVAGYTAAYNGGSTMTTTGTKMFTILSSGNGMSGHYSEQTDIFGQSYAQWDWSEGTVHSGGGYLIVPPNYANANYIYGNKVAENSKYYAISEFDINMVNINKWLTFQSCPRVWVDQYDASGNKISGTNSAKYTSGLPHTSGSYSNNTNLQFTNENGGASKYVTLANGEKRSYGPDDWARITAIIEYSFGAKDSAHKIQAYSAKNTQATGETATLECIEVAITVSYFADGDLIGSYPVKNVGYNGWVPTTSGTCFGFDEFRLGDPDVTSGTFRITNLQHIQLDKDYDFTYLCDPATTVNLKEVEMVDGYKFCSLPEMKTTAGLVAMLDGKPYYSEAELINALASVKGGDGAIVELFADITSHLNISGLTDLRIKSNGHTVAGYISSDVMIDDYTGATGYLVAGMAAPEDIKTFTFQFGKNGETMTMNSVVGTYLGIPEFYDAASPAFGAEVGEEYGEDGYTSYYTTLVDWTVAADGVTPDRLVKADSEKVTAIAEKAAAVRVEIDVNADGIIDYNDSIETFNPNALNTPITLEYLNNMYNLEWSGVKIEVTDHESGWYKLRTGYNQADIDAIDYTKGGTYVIRSGQYELVPYVDMFANITVYTYFQMNYYLPAYSMEAAGVDANSVVVTSGGTALNDFQTANNKGDKYEIDGKNYQRWAKNVGAGATEDHEIIVNYTVNGQKLVYTVNFGLPSYANVVMTDNVNYGDTSKTLIMNMVNYATQLGALTGDNDVPALYNELMATYGDKYLALYNGLTDDKFVEGGDIYANEVAGIDNTLAETYVKGISLVVDSFEPQFRVKYTDAAEAMLIKEKGGWGNSSNPITVRFQMGGSDEFYVTNKAFVTATGEATSWKNTQTEGANYDYYAYTVSYGYSSYEYYTGSWNRPAFLAMDDYTSVGKFSVWLWDATANDGAGKVVQHSTYEFTVASYINGLITLQAAEEANPEATVTVTDADIALAKCIYAYAQAANAFMGIA